MLHAYGALPINEDDGASDVSSEPKPKRNQFMIIGLAAMVCLICTVINVVVVFHIPTVVDSTAEIPLTYTGINQLRRPSQFIGLDRVKRPSPPIPLQFDNYPIVVTQIDEARAEKVFEGDLKRYTGRAGTVYPEDRRILITPSVSTVVQFRAIDYGMEICELHVNLPPLLPNSTLYPGYTFMVTLHRLDVSAPLDTRSLSYNSRPHRLFKIDDIPLSSEGVTHWHRKFSCSSEEVLSFELSRPSFDEDYNGRVEWWQDRTSNGSGPGIYITQYSTI